MEDLLARRQVESFRNRVGGHFARTSPELPSQYLNNRAHSTLHDPRIYPTRTSVEGPHPYRHWCRNCGRANRVFYSPFLRYSHIPTRDRCSICSWKKENCTLFLLTLYRLWPVPGKVVRTRIAAFLCTQGWQARFSLGMKGIYVVTPRVEYLLSEARRHTWHAILYSGFRAAQEGFCRRTGIVLEHDFRFCEPWVSTSVTQTE